MRLQKVYGVWEVDGGSSLNNMWKMNKFNFK